MEHKPQRLEYATPAGENDGSLGRFVLHVVLAMSGLIGLLAGFLLYGVASGAPGEEPNHKMVAVGEVIMASSGIALLLAWRLRF